MPSLSQLSEAVVQLNQRPMPRREQGVQVSVGDMGTGTSSRSSTPAVKLLAKAPSLDPPPALNFESTPVPWKGMTLQAAQWTFSSEQLQAIVSRAIRSSAQEGFIKLLSVKILDEELVAEMLRLDTVKATTQAQYRFNMHRRTMLLQSLMALAANGDADSNTAMVNLTTQLAEITVSCDRLMENMLRTCDQRAQIQHLQDIHVSSALAMALRKLNGSYAKRTAELKEARTQIEQLKAELEEAWNVAEDMAQEMDDLDNFHSGFSSGGDDGEDMTSANGLKAGEDDTLNDVSVRMARVVPILGTAVASKATLTNLIDEPVPVPAPEPTPGPSAPSTPGITSSEKDMDRTSRVFAARKRSSRTSKASLRIPKSATTPPADRTSVFSKRSRSKSLRGGEPAVPPIPVDSFLEMAETRPTSPAQSAHAMPPVPQLPTAVTEQPTSPRPSTPQFEIPPITIDYADMMQRKSSIPSRRIKSMQPPVRARSMDDSDIDTAATRRVSKAEYKKFDGWPWGGGSKKSKRHSVPLTRMALDTKNEVAERTVGMFKRESRPRSSTSLGNHLHAPSEPA
ncbi:hypothetical protein EUX98_g8247 [Antrodiella citrinella]|uniref:Uncharacterized protein n=1 Tax=Antrodiella citrinella TaxID=2447956 RepID=A0A4S4MG68_9APHY|nr:hypothetical protein EUX98_g8247 [Antrodiella citrinella]